MWAPATSGVPTELRVSTAFTIGAGTIVRGREHTTKDEALAAIAQDR
jgi:hypothetical protein